MSQQNILELAKQGDAQAIASLMNRQLQPKGITAKATIDNSCLQIMLLSLDKNKFSTSITELELGIASETDYYNYSITNADTSEAIATATAKENGMKSYTGAVFMVKDSEYDFDTTKAVICETNSASKTPPKNPQLVGEDIQCAKGSKKLD
jgi:hypothetical protein